MSISQFSALQLIAFLERRSFKDFSNIQGFRKVMGAMDQLKKDLGDYYDQYVKLEVDSALAINPYIKKAGEIRAANAPMEDDSAEIKATREATIKKELEKLQAKMDKDEKVAETAKLLNEFKKENDKKQVELEVKNPDQKLAVKELFEVYALNYDGWVSKNILAELTEFLGV